MVANAACHPSYKKTSRSFLCKETRANFPQIVFVSTKILSVSYTDEIELTWGKGFHMKERLWTLDRYYNFDTS